MSFEESTVDSTDRSQHSQVGEALGIRILCHPDAGRLGEVALLPDPGAGVKVALGRTSPAFRTPTGRISGALASRRVSRSPVLLQQTTGGDLLVTPSEKNTCLNGAPMDGPTTVPFEQLEAGFTLQLGKYVLLWVGPVDARVDTSPQRGLLGHSRAMRALRDRIDLIARQDVAVLLRGETGVGKELVARALHLGSARASGPYVGVNLAAIPETVAVAELFGYARGAFTGADRDRGGHFQAANGGTLLLDEIGEAPDAIQPMLLRALETGTVQPVGGKETRVDVRLIAATDADLEAHVERGRFRSALLSRLGYELSIPPLRHRREDIPTLFRHFLREEFGRQGKEMPQARGEDADTSPWLPARFLSQLCRAHWPRNVRELRNVARRLAVRNHDAPRLRVDDELVSLLQTSLPESVEEKHHGVERLRAAELQDAQVESALARCRYGINQTAAELGVSRSWLHARINKMPGVRKGKDLDATTIAAAIQGEQSLEAAAQHLRVSHRALVLQMRRLGLVPDTGSGQT